MIRKTILGLAGLVLAASTLAGCETEGKELPIFNVNRKLSDTVKFYHMGSIGINTMMKPTGTLIAIDGDGDGIIDETVTTHKVYFNSLNRMLNNPSVVVYKAAPGLTREQKYIQASDNAVTGVLTLEDRKTLSDTVKILYSGRNK